MAKTFPIVSGKKNSIFANHSFAISSFARIEEITFYCVVWYHCIAIKCLRNTTLYTTMSIIFTLHHTTYGLWTAQNGVI